MYLFNLSAIGLKKTDNVEKWEKGKNVECQIRHSARAIISLHSLQSIHVNICFIYFCSFDIGYFYSSTIPIGDFHFELVGAKKEVVCILSLRMFKHHAGCCLQYLSYKDLKGNDTMTSSFRPACFSITWCQLGNLCSKIFFCDFLSCCSDLSGHSRSFLRWE